MTISLYRLKEPHDRKIIHKLVSSLGAGKKIPGKGGDGKTKKWYQ